MIAEDASGVKSVLSATVTAAGAVKPAQELVLSCGLDSAALAHGFRFNVSSTTKSAYTSYLNPSSTHTDLKMALDAVSYVL